MVEPPRSSGNFGSLPPPPPPHTNVTLRTSGSTSTWNEDNGVGRSPSSRSTIISHSPSDLGFAPSSFNLSPNPQDSGNVVSSHVPSVHLFSEESQEKFIVQELLYILAGVDSCLISCHNVTKNKIGFSVDRRIQPTLSSFALEVAQLAGHYYTVNRYVEEIFKYEDGRVVHALVSTIQEILKEYFIMLTQLNVEFRKGNLNLRNLWFFINPTLAKMAILSSIVVELEDKGLVGGAVLTHLHEKSMAMMNSSDQNLCLFMAERSSVPYFETLEQWIYKGVIKDRFSEFFVLDSDNSNEEAEINDDYWEKRYKVIPEKCPAFLSKNISHVLKAGKYLNVIRHCGKDVKTFQGEKIVYSIHERDYMDKIDKAYSFASKKLLTLLLDEYDLMKRLESVKHYLLMDKGDFIVQFMDLTDIELSKPIDDLNPSRLESLMGLALRTSSAYNDPYKDSLKVQLFPYGIGDQLLTIIAIETPMERTDFPQVCNYKLPGAEGFSFSYDVKWPISLVLTPRVIVCYQLVFRHLFFCKHVERQLCNMWISSKGCVGTALSDQKDKAVVFALRQKMLNFVQNFQYYMAFEVIEPAWNAFLMTMQKVSNVDEVLECHLGMITSILDDSMLTIKVLLEKVTRILNLCLRFCKKISLMYSQNNFDTHIYEKICAADVKFSKMLVSFLKEVSEISQSSNKSNKVGNIIHRMNFNGYYTSSLEDSANTTQQPSSLSVPSLRKPIPSISNPFD